jgi:Mor family transcriptional regulator
MKPGEYMSLDDDVVRWLVELLDELATDYRRLGAPQGAVTVERLEQLRRQLDETIRSHWGGQMLYVPRAAWNNLAQRDEAIRQERANGASQRDTALKYNVSRAQVRRICGELE